MRNKIVVIGSLNYDVILKLPHFPVAGENVLANSVNFSAGGKGANQAVQAAKLGSSTYMVGCVGKDFYGDELIASAKKYGLNTDYVRRVDAPTGMGFVNAIEDGSVFAGILKGANFEVTKEDVDHVESLLCEAAVVILQMEIPQDVNEYAIKKAKACGARVIMNAAPAAPISEDALKALDILVVNEVEAGFYLGKTIGTAEEGSTAAKMMYERYGCNTIITLGKIGSAICDKGVVKVIPSKKVKAIETTGAGDTFIGATAHSLIYGMSLFEAGEFATYCSALTVQRIGAQDSMGTLEEVNQFIDAYRG